MMAVALPAIEDRRPAASRNPRVGQVTVTTLGRVISKPERRYRASVRLARGNCSDRVFTPVAATGLGRAGAAGEVGSAAAWTAGAAGRTSRDRTSPRPSKACSFEPELSDQRRAFWLNRVALGPGCPTVEAGAKWAKMSALVRRPPRPVPWTRAGSIFSSATIRRTDGASGKGALPLVAPVRSRSAFERAAGDASGRGGGIGGDSAPTATIQPSTAPMGTSSPARA